MVLGQLLLVLPGCDGGKALDTGPADPWQCDTEDLELRFRDYDGDGFGVSDRTKRACIVPEGFAAVDGDCSPADSGVYPGAEERCNDIDDDCDGLVDDADPGVRGTIAWYVDTDGDGYGDTSTKVSACEGPEGYIQRDGDCNDLDAAISPEAAEICNDGIDQDCSDAGGGCGFEPVVVVGTDTARGRIVGEDMTDALGYTVAGIGDVDGDGLDDVAVGETSVGESTGRVGIFLGPVEGEHTAATPDRIIVDEDAFISLGYSLLPIAVGGSPLPALAVGAPGDNDWADSAGSVYIFSAEHPEHSTVADAWARVDATGYADSLGLELAAGDFDGDGVDGLLASGDGFALLYHSVAEGVYLDTEADAWTEDGVFRGDLASVDLDADGLDEAAFGISTDDYVATDGGAVWVFDGLAEGELDERDADLRLMGTGEEDRVGWAMLAGDFTGDGHDDFVLGSQHCPRGGDEAGAVWLVAGPFVYSSAYVDDATWSVLGSEPDSQLGYPLADLGDVGLGVESIGVSAHLSSDERTYIFDAGGSGALTLADALVSFDGGAEASGTQWVSRGGDVNADGVNDVLLGMPQTDSGRGSAWVFWGGGE